VIFAIHKASEPSNSDVVQERMIVTEDAFVMVGFGLKAVCQRLFLVVGKVMSQGSISALLVVRQIMVINQPHSSTLCQDR